MRSPKYLPLLAVLVLGFLISTPNIADAATAQPGEPIQVFGIAQQDLNGDAQPDVTLIDCAFATAHDRVLVYDQNGDMPVGGQWEQVTDFQDDVWVFDAGADGSAQLIVDFNVEGGKYTALIYDDIDGDGQVGYAVDGKQVTIEESTFWHLKVEIGSRLGAAGRSEQLERFLIRVDGYSSSGVGAEV